MLEIFTNFKSLIMIMLALALIVFWIWMLVDMFTSKKLQNTEKGLWFIAFLLLAILTPIVWLFVRK